jgi:hypothetical protein
MIELWAWKQGCVYLELAGIYTNYHLLLFCRSSKLRSWKKGRVPGWDGVDTRWSYVPGWFIVLWNCCNSHTFVRSCYILPGAVNYGMIVISMLILLVIYWKLCDLRYVVRILLIYCWYFWNENIVFGFWKGIDQKWTYCKSWQLGPND